MPTAVELALFEQSAARRHVPTAVEVALFEQCAHFQECSSRPDNNVSADIAIANGDRIAATNAHVMICAWRFLFDPV